MNGSIWQRWHRTTGIIVAVIVVLLSISGVMLNHPDAFGLRNHYVASDWLLDLYGIDPETPPVAFAAGGHWVTRIGERLYFDRSELSVRGADLIGAVADGGNIVVALDNRLLVLSDAGATIELLEGAEGVPAGMKAIGTTANGRLILDAAHGRYLADLNSLAWSKSDGIDAALAVPAKPAAELSADLLRLYRGTGLSLERVLSDLHSGRIFGPIGNWVVDLAGALFLFLAVSGTWMWLRRPVD